MGYDNDSFFLGPYPAKEVSDQAGGRGGRFGKSPMEQWVCGCFCNMLNPLF